MPLYEIVLRFADRDEVRLGDGDGYEVGDTVAIDYRDYLVVAVEAPRSEQAVKRVILRLDE
jgi:hypothetical protein